MTPFELADAFDAAAGRAGSLAGVLDKFVDVMNASIQKNFDVEGRPNRWADIKRMHPGHKAILHDTGTLRNSAKAIREDHDVILVAGGDGQPPAKAPALHYGAQLHGRRRGISGRFVSRRARKDVAEGSGGLPARPYLIFQPEDLAYLGDEMPAWIFTDVRFLS